MLKTILLKLLKEASKAYFMKTTTLYSLILLKVYRIEILFYKTKLIFCFVPKEFRLDYEYILI